MAKEKSKKPSSRAKPKRAAKPADKAAARAKSVKPAAKPKTAKSKTVTAKTGKRTASKPKSAKAAAKPKSAKSTRTRPAKAKAAAKRAARPKTKAKPKALPVSKSLLEKPSAPVARAIARPPQIGRDWSATLFLPKTDFPMKAGLPEREPELLKRWQRVRLYDRMREEAMGREKFILHDGPPYANGNIHIGTGLNKILKDVINRSQRMMGKDANYVPGWDCHGLPIEWKIEEENYRAKGKTKPDLSDPAAMIAFRQECRAYAQHWLDVQREEFRRLGVEGDWDHPYTTMSFDAEATIAAELMKFAMNGLLYRGSKPVMWSVVEKTALAEAEVEYQEITSPAIYVKFPLKFAGTGTHHPRVADEKDAYAEKLASASIVIWTTTPWTIPGNRAISYSPRIGYGLYEVQEALEENWAKTGDRLVLADGLAESVRVAARVESWRRLGDVTAEMQRSSVAKHPLHDNGYDFDVPLLAGEHVTEDTGTGFVHTAPGHGTDDFEIWAANETTLRQRRIDTKIPFTVDADGYFTKEAPGFEGKRVVDDKGKFGDANEAVIEALIKANALLARARYKHDYPHSWRSKKPVIFRNTPQWFIAMDSAIDADAPTDTLRHRALAAISETRWVPPQGENRIRGMIDTKPDWVVSRQRAWACPSPCSAISIRARRALTTSCRARNIPGRKRSSRECARPSPKKALTLGSSRARENASSAAWSTTRQSGKRSTTSSMFGSTPAPPTPSCSRFAPISLGRPRSISKARTSIAAGSNPRCLRLAEPAAAHLTRPCSPMASSSTRTAAKCRSRSAMSWPRRT